MTNIVLVHKESEIELDSVTQSNVRVNKIEVNKILIYKNKM